MKHVMRGLSVLLLLVISTINAQTKGHPSHQIEHIVDGDTLDVTNVGRIRLIGMDAPEAHNLQRGMSQARDHGLTIDQVLAFGQQASANLKRLCSGQPISLEYDNGLRDRYGRTLAYVTCGNKMVNLEQVRAGLAWTLTIEPNTKHQSELLQAERFARLAHLNLWK